MLPTRLRSRSAARDVDGALVKVLQKEQLVKSTEIWNAWVNVDKTKRRENTWYNLVRSGSLWKKGYSHFMSEGIDKYKASIKKQLLLSTSDVLLFYHETAPLYWKIRPELKTPKIKLRESNWQAIGCTQLTWIIVKMEILIFDTTPKITALSLLLSTLYSIFYH